MIDPSSRYADLANAMLIIENPDGTRRTLVYKQRRLLPSQPELTQVTIEHTVDEDDRLDRIAARYLGDPTLFWQLCDRNGGLHPTELTEQIGRRLVVSSRSR